MISKMITIGGILQLLLGLFHVFLGWKMMYLASSGLAQKVYATLQMLNAALTLALFYFAYLFLFQKAEILSTQTGKVSLIFVALIYFARALGEMVLYEFSLFWFLLCLVLGLYFLVPLFVPRKNPSRV